VTLSHDEARAFYDRFGARQDWQRFYEDPATAAMIRSADFAEARSVVEFGCGTGRFAAELLAHHLPDSARYTGFDVSATMVRLASQALAPWSGRAEARLSDGTMRLPLAEASADRFVSTYVLDLLSEADAHALIDAARRILVGEGRLCLVSLTAGATPFARAVTAIWKRVHRANPRLLGGCRPVALREALAPGQWRIAYRGVVTRFGISSEVLVATPM
jgi:SAM-dependent methyltransferase